MLAQAVEPGLTWPQVAGGIAAILTTVALVGGGIGWAARRARQRLEALVGQVVEQVTPSNGTRLAEYAEQTSAELGQVREDVTALSVAATENRAQAKSAMLLAQHAHERIDSHLMGHNESKE